MEQKNVIITIVLSIIILTGWQVFYEGPRLEQQKALQAQTQEDASIPSPQANTSPTHIQDAPIVIKDRSHVLEETQRVIIDTVALKGSINLKGGRIDDMILKRYNETADSDSKQITLLSPVGSKDPYFIDMGWVNQNPNQPLPDSNTVWKVEGNNKLSPDAPVTLTWNNQKGLIFKRTYSIDENYMISVDQVIENKTGNEQQFYPYALSSRYGKPKTLDFFILHEGLLGVFNDTLEELDYDKIKDKKLVEFSSQGGWIGITDKYWLVSVIPDQTKQNKSRFQHLFKNNQDRYQIDVLGEGVSVANNNQHSTTTRFYVGAKKAKLFDQYAEEYKIDRFDLAIDFGWFYFLTKPIFTALLWIYSLVGNFGVAILILTVFVKLLFFPLANKSYHSMSRMRLLHPELMKIRERFKDDKMRMNQEIMGLYKKEKVNPASGCLPILIQIPVFFALYKVLFVAIEMRHAPFFGWITDLSAPDPTSFINLFGLLPFDAPSFLQIGIWPLIMGGTMFLQQKLNPQPADPIQAKVFMFMPIIFTILLASFPAGLVIYWAWNNILSIIQQWYIMQLDAKKYGKKKASTKS